MKALKLLTVGAAAAISVCAVAQFDGPTPLAWRWTPPAVDYTPDGAPTVANGMVYVAAKSRIFALDATTGNERWKFPLGKTGEGAKGTFRVQPVVTPDAVIDFTDAGYFYAGNIKDGTTKWVYQLEKNAAVGEPVVIGNLIIFKQGDNTLNALSADTGQPAWPKPLPIDSGFDGPLLVHDQDVLFADNNNQLYSIDAVTQKVNWKRQFGFLPPGLEPVLFGDNIYLYSGRYLVCMNAIRGFAKWQVNLGQNMEFGPAVSPDGMMCVTEDGKLFFFDLNGHRGPVREVISLGSGPAAQPSAVGSKFIVPTNNGALNLIDPKTGQTLWVYTVRPIVQKAALKGERATFNGTDIIDPRVLTVPAAGPPLLNGSTLLVMCTDASLLAFDPKIGVDLTPPEADMLFPNEGAQICGNPPLDIIFKVSDEATGVNNSTLKIDVDGKPLDFAVGRDGIALVHFSSSSAKNTGLADGRRILTVTVSDWMGNQTKKSFSLLIDNTLPPLETPKNMQPDQGGSRGKGGGGAGAGGGIG